MGTGTPQGSRTQGTGRDPQVIYVSPLTWMAPGTGLTLFLPLPVQPAALLPVARAVPAAPTHPCTPQPPRLDPGLAVPDWASLQPSLPVLSPFPAFSDLEVSLCGQSVHLIGALSGQRVSGPRAGKEACSTLSTLSGFLRRPWAGWHGYASSPPSVFLEALTRRRGLSEEPQA